MIGSWHWILYVTGGWWPTAIPTIFYNELSGFVSIIGPPILTLAGLALLWAWHSQCHVTGCYWPTRRLTAANEKACWRHYPHPHRTAEDIRAAHHLYLGKQPGKG